MYLAIPTLKNYAHMASHSKQLGLHGSNDRVCEGWCKVHNLVPILSYTYSIGFKSGKQDGHGLTFTLAS